MLFLKGEKKSQFSHSNEGIKYIVHYIEVVQKIYII